jgi:signal transduction histidine kinase/PAS domain-containing protein
MATRDSLRRPSTADRITDPAIQRLAGSLPQLVWTMDVDGRVDYGNPSWRAYSESPGSSGRWIDPLHPQDREQASDAWQHASLTGDPFHLRCRMRDPATGRYRWFECHAVPMRGESGDVSGWVVTGTDIDDARHAVESERIVAGVSEALASSMDVKRALLSISTDLVNTGADWCAIDLTPGVQRNGGSTHEIRRVATAWRDTDGSVHAAEGPGVDDPPLARRFAHRLLASRNELALGSDGLRENDDSGTTLGVPILDATGFVRGGVAAADSGRGPRIQTPPRPGSPSILGMLLLYTAAPARAYDERDQRMARQIAHRIALALEQSRLFDEAISREKMIRQLASELTEQNARLQAQAIELESRNERLAEQASQLERQANGLRRGSAELAATNERLRLATEAGHFGTWDFDLLSRELVWDERCRAAHGFAPDQPVDIDSFLAGLADDDRETIERTMRAMTDPASGSGEGAAKYKVRLPNGTIRWISSRGRAVFANVPTAHGTERRAIRLVGTLRDITLEHAEADRLRDDAALVATLKQIGSGLTPGLAREPLAQAVTDAATQLVGARLGVFLLNASGANDDGCTQFSIVGADRSSFEALPAPMQSPIFARTFELGEVVRVDDLVAESPDGGTALALQLPAGHPAVRSYLALPVLSRSGALLGVLQFGHFAPGRFTERQERLARGVAEWAAVAVDHAQLHEAERAARAEAEDANRSKAQFLATMSHELRTPLNAISGYTDLLLLGVRGELTSDQRSDVERIRRSGQLLLSLINDILNFARVEAGQLEFNVEAVPVTAMLDELKVLMAPQVEQRGLELTVRACASAGTVRGDRERVWQILMNLVSNAIKFTDSGGAIHLWCECDPTWTRICVRDTGRGIAPQDHARIFDAFVQVDRQLTDVTWQGVGVGLAISRELAKGMGGALQVDSDVGAGATFVLTLPTA